MLRPLACIVALVLMAAPGAARQGRQMPAAGASAILVGLPVFTSDGREIGHITEVASEPREPMLIAQVEQPGGIGPRTIAIPIDVFVQRADRIELALTFEQVSDRLEGPEPER